ncbi:hypothetical protein HE1_00935 [Holospora elegans E1]|uniref:Uncharacterized protein n=1 Tax=Holospora elegans E1 TaxID=1427503 RepID=A0A023DZU6_9PROT|nr:hypothetical protein [Holospora elegans]GAJ46600.1 hypothetical protein HE1_00935 [Holospora elegans E1]
MGCNQGRSPVCKGCSIAITQESRGKNLAFGDFKSTHSLKSKNEWKSVSKILASDADKKYAMTDFCLPSTRLR